MDVAVDSCVHVYHIYQAVWVPVIGEHSNCKQEMGNAEDRHAAAICKLEGEVVGHVPRTVSCMNSSFIR